MPQEIEAQGFSFRDLRMTLTLASLKPLSAVYRGEEGSPRPILSALRVRSEGDLPCEALAAAETRLP